MPRLLADWVKEGGALLATYDSGLYNEKGELRQDGGALRDILGVDMKGEAPEGHTDTFYRITQSHPALGEYHEGKIVMGDAKLVPITVRPGATVLAEGLNLDFQKTSAPPSSSINTGEDGSCTWREVWKPNTSPAA